MQLKLFAPGPFDAKLNFVAKDPDSSVLLNVLPIQNKKSQRTCQTIPYEITDGGEVKDRGYISVSFKTGKLCIEHYGANLGGPSNVV